MYSTRQLCGKACMGTRLQFLHINIRAGLRSLLQPTVKAGKCLNVASVDAAALYEFGAGSLSAPT